MATRLYLRSTTWDTNRYKLSTTPGTAVVTKVVNTAAAVQVQWTDGAGGSAIEWCSDPVNASFTISSAVTFNIWAQESSMNANAGGRARLYKVSNDRATWTEMGGGPFDDQTEFGFSSRTVFNWTGTPTSNNALSAGDRVGVRIFLDDNCGVALATGYNCTLAFDDDVGAADGDTYIETVENLTFSSPQTITGVAAETVAALTVAALLAGAVTLVGQEPVALAAVTTADIQATQPPTVDFLWRLYQRTRRCAYLRM